MIAVRASVWYCMRLYHTLTHRMRVPADGARAIGVARAAMLQQGQAVDGEELDDSDSGEDSNGSDYDGKQRCNDVGDDDSDIGSDAEDVAAVTVEGDKFAAARRVSRVAKRGREGAPAAAWPSEASLLATWEAQSAFAFKVHDFKARPPSESKQSSRRDKTPEAKNKTYTVRHCRNAGENACM